MTIPATHGPPGHSKLGSFLALLAGLGWLFLISLMAEEVGKVANSQFVAEFKLGRGAELLIFASCALPLAFVHNAQASVLRITLTHSGVYSALATICLLFSPSPPLAILPWSEMRYDAPPIFWGPLLVWGVSAVALVSASAVLAWRLRAPAKAESRLLIMTAVAALVSGIQWWVTARIVVGGTLMHTLAESVWQSLIRWAVVLAYVAVAAVSCGMIGPKGRASN